MTEGTLRAVFDCGVFLQGLISKSGPAVACLELVEQGKVNHLFQTQKPTNNYPLLGYSNLGY